MPYKTEKKVGMQCLPNCQNVLTNIISIFSLYGPILQNNEKANIHAGKSGLIKTSCTSCSHLEPTIFVVLTYIRA